MIFRIAWLYYDLLDLYGDVGNIKVLEYILKENAIEYTVDKITIGMTSNLSTYDIIFLGGGSDLNQTILSEDLNLKREAFINAMNDKTFILTICGGYQMFGKYYIDSLGNKIKCLDIFDYYTLAEENRSVGNIKIKPNVHKFNFSDEIIGFENHGGQTLGISKEDSLGEVIFGFGNNKDKKYEGYVDNFFIGTYCHGPLLPQNPKIAKYIIEKVLKEKYNINKEINLNFKEEIKRAKQEVEF